MGSQRADQDDATTAGGSIDKYDPMKLSSHNSATIALKRLLETQRMEHAVARNSSTHVTTSPFYPERNTSDEKDLSRNQFTTSNVRKSPRGRRRVVTAPENYVPQQETPFISYIVPRYLSEGRIVDSPSGADIIEFQIYPDHSCHSSLSSNLESSFDKFGLGDLHSRSPEVVQRCSTDAIPEKDSVTVARGPIWTTDSLVNLDNSKCNGEIRPAASAKQLEREDPVSDDSENAPILMDLPLAFEPMPTPFPVSPYDVGSVPAINLPCFSTPINDHCSVTWVNPFRYPYCMPHNATQSLPLASTNDQILPPLDPMLPVDGFHFSSPTTLSACQFTSPLLTEDPHAQSKGSNTHAASECSVLGSPYNSPLLFEISKENPPIAPCDSETFNLLLSQTTQPNSINFKMDGTCLSTHDLNGFDICSQHYSSARWNHMENGQHENGHGVDQARAALELSNPPTPLGSSEISIADKEVVSLTMNHQGNRSPDVPLAARTG
jgi:hypothetical protein